MSGIGGKENPGIRRLYLRDPQKKKDRGYTLQIAEGKNWGSGNFRKLATTSLELRGLHQGCSSVLLSSNRLPFMRVMGYTRRWLGCFFLGTAAKKC